MTDERMAPGSEGPGSADASAGIGPTAVPDLPDERDARPAADHPGAAWPAADARTSAQVAPAIPTRPTPDAWPAADAPPSGGPPSAGSWLLDGPDADPAPGNATGTWAAAASARSHVPAVGHDEGGPGGTGRAADGRLARVHLRGGLLTLARASLEQMAGVGALDREALADLAEARWRSGDLEGAAEAAAAHLDAGGDEPLAHLIVAEEADRQGSLVDARRHAAVVRERVGTGLDRLFAGETRSTAWPLEGVDWMDDGATAPGRWGLLAGGREVADPQPRSWRMLPPPAAGSPVARPRVPLAAAAAAAAAATQSTLDQLELGRAAGVELEAAEDELARGAIADAVERLALVLRFDPALAPVILSMADRALATPDAGHQGLVALHLLRGDAYRGLGRETDAVDAYQESMRALTARATHKESP